MGNLTNLVVSERETKIERTTVHIDTVVSCVPYSTSTGLKGLEFKLKGLPYPVRVLTKDIPALFIGCKVQFVGTMREYQGKQYFNPMDIEVVEQSTLSKLATAGIAYAGAL
jgi:hypothetical protein